MRLAPVFLMIATTLATAGCGRAHAAPTAPAAKAAAVRAQARAAEIEQATVQQAWAYVQATPAAQFIDVRMPEEFAEGRAQGVVNRPLPDLAAWAGDLAKDRPVVVICRSGSRSMKACQALVGRGFGHVTNVQGGTLAWEADGSLPMEYGPPKP